MDKGCFVLALAVQRFFCRDVSFRFGSPRIMAPSSQLSTLCSELPAPSSELEAHGPELQARIRAPSSPLRALSLISPFLAKIIYAILAALWPQYMRLVPPGAWSHALPHALPPFFIVIPQKPSHALLMRYSCVTHALPPVV